MNRFVWIPAMMLAGLAISNVLSAPAAQQPAYRCLTQADTAAAAVRSVSITLNGIDSLDAVRAGFPYEPANVAIVADTVECRLVLQAYNGLATPAESLKRIYAGYVVKAWPPPAYGLYLPAPEPYFTETFYFDSTYAFKVRLTDLR